MEQARKALKYCLDNLGKSDRFGLVGFATTVNRYKDGLLDASSDQVAQAKKWDDVIAWLRRVVTLTPKDALAYQMMGKIHLRSERWDEAATSFGKAGLDALESSFGPQPSLL